MLKRKKTVRLWFKYQVWFYRFILIIAVLGLVVFGGRYNNNRSQDKNNNANSSNNFYNNFLNLPEMEPQDNDLYISEDEDNQVLDETLKKIFPEGTEKLSDEEKAVELARFVPTYFYLEAAQGINVSKLLIGRKTLCQGMATVFTTLTRKLNLPARNISVYYIPGNHVAAEVYYNGGWHYFDPTLGVFAYSRSSYNKEGNILSFQELQTGKEHYLQQLTDKPWVGEYTADSRKFGVQPIKKEYGAIESFPNYEDFLHSQINNSFPAAFGNDSWISMPIDIDFKDKSYEKIGEIDQNPSELAWNDKKYMGTSYFGTANGLPSAYNTWKIDVSPPPIYQN